VPSGTLNHLSLHASEILEQDEAGAVIGRPHTDMRPFREHDGLPDGIVA
jgi:hypothetical protein